MQPGEPPSRCTHGHSASTCWDCLSPESQSASRRAWSALESSLGFVVAPDEVLDGRMIEMHRGDPDGPRILLTHTLFNQCIEMLLNEQVSVNEH